MSSRVNIDAPAARMHGWVRLSHVVLSGSNQFASTLCQTGLLIVTVDEVVVSVDITDQGVVDSVDIIDQGVLDSVDIVGEGLPRHVRKRWQ